MVLADTFNWRGPVLTAAGLHNSGAGHWQTRWERLWPHFERVQQDDWSAPDLDRWARRIVEAALRAEAPVLVVAHSFGCLATIRAEAFQSGLIAGALLVAPADPARFGIEQRMAGLAAPLFTSTVIASSDDPWMPATRARLWAERWGSQFVEAGAQGHLNAESGLGDWVAGQQQLEWLCRRMSGADARMRRAAA